MKIKKICFIGYGNHIKNTIIPSLLIKKKNIKIVTKKVISENFETFKEIKYATNNLDKNYVFYNSTPPKDHFLTSKKILNSGFNLIVEKPICVSSSQYISLKKIADKKGLFLFENMMYLFSKQFSVFNKENKNLEKLKKIEMNFSIPSFAPNSFRNSYHIENSLLYDVGCYPISLISFLGINLSKLKLKYKRKNKILSDLYLSAISKKILINIEISFYKEYKNYVKLEYLDSSYSIYNHFFYGKKIKKENIKVKKNGELKKININEINIFKKVFKFRQKEISSISNNNEMIIKNYLKILDSIKKKIIQ
jgi:hypothetical protein